MDTEVLWGGGCQGCSSMLLLLQFAGLHTKLPRPSSKSTTLLATVWPEKYNKKEGILSLISMPKKRRREFSLLLYAYYNLWMRQSLPAVGDWRRRNKKKGCVVLSCIYNHEVIFLFLFRVCNLCFWISWWDWVLVLMIFFSSYHEEIGWIGLENFEY